MAYRNYTRTAPATRWMNARKSGVCKVCNRTIGIGDHIFWDSGSRTVTCDRIECCEADGLTTRQWAGSPVSGKFVSTRTATRIGSPYTATSNN